MNSPHHSITVRRLIKAERNRVFAAFASSETLGQWFSPSADITIELQEFEFSPLGTFRLRYTMPDGTRPMVGGMYERIERPNQIVFTWQWEAPDPHADIPTRVFVDFHERGAHTEVVLTQEQLPKEACDRHIRGWQATLGRLESFLGLIATSIQGSEAAHDG